MLLIKIPPYCRNEQTYIINVLLGEFLGLTYTVEEHEGICIEIRKANSPINSSKLTIDAGFFQKAARNWLLKESMPTLPLHNWIPSDDGIQSSLIESSIPVLFGKPGLIKNNNNFHLNVDIFGSAFFMISRYEEMISKDKDCHGRFPGTASIAYKAGFLSRPIVNEYLEILWYCLEVLWPDLARKDRNFKKRISCDLDHPFDLIGHSLSRTILRIGARIVRDKSPVLALYDGLNYIFKKFNSDRFDIYRKNVDWMMKENIRAGNKMAFYFIPIQTNVTKEDKNDIRDRKNLELMSHIAESGHEVGIHPGYNTYKNTEIFKRSARAFFQACDNIGLPSTGIGGRQHYLRFDVSATPQLWESEGFEYDSSLGFADRAGFRAGVCYEYPMYDLIKRSAMKIKQRPLIVMECTIMDKAYENLGCTQEALDRINYLKSTCSKFSGDFTLLWHNSYLINSKLKKFYLEAIY